METTIHILKRDNQWWGICFDRRIIVSGLNRALVLDEITEKVTSQCSPLTTIYVEENNKKKFLKFVRDSSYMTNQDLLDLLKKHRGLVTMSVPGYINDGEPTNHFVIVSKAKIIEHIRTWGASSRACFDIVAVEDEQIILGREQL